jgi:uncharacterized protein YbbK (DUF523 family)
MVGKVVRLMSERSGDHESDRGWSKPLLVSACLLGVRCNHEGEANTSEAVVALRSRFRLVPICPETAGGLPTPRPYAEVQPDGTVRSGEGDDVTDAYRRGAAHALRLARSVGATGAVLKARSPSCGCHEIYDGSFTRTRVPGEGVTARALREAGLAVTSEHDIATATDPTDPGRPPPDQPGHEVT